MNSEPHLYAVLMDEARRSLIRNLDRLGGTDIHQRPVVQGVQLNSVYWIAGHLAVSQNWLVLRGSGGPFRKFSWAKHFSLGADAANAVQGPPMAEVRAMLDEVHSLSMAHVAGLDEAALSAPHQALMDLLGGRDVRAVLRHHIRHESGHVGQLDWLCKLNGLPTI